MYWGTFSYIQAVREGHVCIDLFCFAINKTVREGHVYIDLKLFTEALEAILA